MWLNFSDSLSNYRQCTQFNVLFKVWFCKFIKIPDLLCIEDVKMALPDEVRTEVVLTPMKEWIRLSWSGIVNVR